MSSPTKEQIAIVRNNLSTLVEVNLEIKPDVMEKIQNAYLLFTIPDESDPGMSIVLSMMEGAFKAIGEELGGEAGGKVAGFLAGMLSDWITKVPNDMNRQFASYYERYQETSRVFTAQLDRINQRLNPENNDQGTIDAAWNTKFTYNGQTVAVSDLASAVLPKIRSEKYDDLADSLIHSHNQAIWKQLLKQNFYVPYYTWYHKGQMPGPPPWGWVEYRLEYYKYCYYVFYKYYDGAWSSDKNFYVYIVNEYVICRKDTVAYHYLNDACCDYLFKDSSPGKIINPKGLFTRKEVVDFLGIQHVETVPYIDQIGVRLETSPHFSPGEFRPLVKPQGRELLEIQVTEKAQEDAVFAAKLAKDPKSALKEYFDVTLPENVSLTVVLEDDQNIGMIIRGAKRE